MPDGVFVEGQGQVRLEKLGPPERSDLERILERVVAKTLQMAKRRGLLDDEPPAGALASMQLEAVQSGLPLPLWPSPPKGLSAFLEGFSLESGTHVHENDRAGLEHLVRYALRPPLALERLTRAADGRVLLRLKRPMYDGTREVAFAPLQLLKSPRSVGASSALESDQVLWRIRPRRRVAQASRAVTAPPGSHPLATADRPAVPPAVGGTHSSDLPRGHSPVHLRRPPQTHRLPSRAPRGSGDASPPRAALLHAAHRPLSLGLAG